MDSIPPPMINKSYLKKDDKTKKRLSLKDLRKRFKCKEQRVEFFLQKGNIIILN
jgi:hypothetical protein